MPARSALVAVALLLTGCADGSDPATDAVPTDDPTEDTAATDEQPDGDADPAPEPVASLSVVGTDEVTWEETELSAPPGPIEFVLSCGDAVAHTIGIEGVRSGAALAGCSGGGDPNNEVVQLDAGTYTFFCTIGNHRQQGMEGTITVG